MRPIDEIILHCSATPRGRDVSADDIRAWHLQRGFSDIGYHYIVLLDGSVAEGRPEEKAGAHCLGHNAHSIGICYVGGLDSDGITPADTRTPAQTAALRRLVAGMMKKYPGASLHGHREFAAKACPCFDVGLLFDTHKPLDPAQQRRRRGGDVGRTRVGERDGRSL